MVGSSNEKMSFNRDCSKQAQEIVFSRKLKKTTHCPLFFNGANVSQANPQKHLGVTLDLKLTFNEHFDIVLPKLCKTLGLLRKLQNFLQRKALITIYNAFLRPHRDYGDVCFAFSNANI